MWRHLGVSRQRSQSHGKDRKGLDARELHRVSLLLLVQGENGTVEMPVTAQLMHMLLFDLLFSD